jgi:hypothetical protein
VFFVIRRGKEATRQLVFLGDCDQGVASMILILLKFQAIKLGFFYPSIEFVILKYMSLNYVIIKAILVMMRLIGFNSNEKSRR